MRWKAKHNNWGTRVVKRFILFPTKYNGEWRWWESVWTIQDYFYGPWITKQWDKIPHYNNESNEPANWAK